MSLLDIVKANKEELEVDQINFLINYLTMEQQKRKQINYARSAGMNQIREAFTREYQF